MVMFPFSFAGISFLSNQSFISQHLGACPTLEKRCVQKVRLMHTSVRYLLLRSGMWPLAELGVRVCQEDLLGTLMIFTVEVLSCLDRMKLAITATQAEDY